MSTPFGGGQGPGKKKVSAQQLANAATPIANRKKVAAKRGAARPNVAPQVPANVPQQPAQPPADTRAPKRKAEEQQEGRPKRLKAQQGPEPPALRITNPSGGREGVCGYFIRTRKLYVTNSGKPGVIVQKVTRNFNVQCWDLGLGAWKNMTGQEIDAYVGAGVSCPYAGVADYWELWKVRPDGTVINGSDAFSLCSIIPPGTTGNNAANTSKGSFTIAGEMYYYQAPTLNTQIDAAALGFQVNQNHPAGQLPNRGDDPRTDLAGLRFVASGQPVQFQVTSTWDSSSPATLDSTITMT